LFVTSVTSFQLHCLPNVSEQYVRKEKEGIESSSAVVTHNLFHETLESLNTSTDVLPDRELKQENIKYEPGC